MSITIKTLVVGVLNTNCYIVYETESKEAMIVDPGDYSRVLASFIITHELKLKYIVATHGHFDHTLGINALRSVFHTKSYMHKKDILTLKYSLTHAGFLLNLHSLELPYIDVYIKENDMFSIGSALFKVIATPGHSPGSICIVGNDMLFSGDTLFYRGIGRTDIPEGDDQLIINSILHKLYNLNESLIVYPGHGPATTIGEEKRENPYITTSP